MEELESWELWPEGPTNWKLVHAPCASPYSNGADKVWNMYNATECWKCKTKIPQQIKDAMLFVK